MLWFDLVYHLLLRALMRRACLVDEQKCTLSVHFILIRDLCHRFLMSLFSVCRFERLVTPVKETASVHAMKMAILRSTMSAR